MTPSKASGCGDTFLLRAPSVGDRPLQLQLQVHFTVGPLVEDPSQLAPSADVPSAVSTRDSDRADVSRPARRHQCTAMSGYRRGSGLSPEDPGSPMPSLMRRARSVSPLPPLPTTQEDDCGLQPGASSQQAVNGGASAADQPGATTGDAAGEASEAQVRRYLAARPDFLERYVLEQVELEQLERWMIRGTQRAKKRPDASGAPAKNGRKTSLSRWKFCVHADKRHMLQELTRSLQRTPSQGNVLWELAGCISSAVGAEGHRLYLAEQGDPEQLGLYLPQSSRSESSGPKVQAMGSGLAVPQYVARTKEPLRLSRTETDLRFPDWLPIQVCGDDTGSVLLAREQGDAGHVLYQPVLRPDGAVAAVVELWRAEGSQPFHEEDEEIASSYLVWGGIALHYAQLYLSMNKQRRLADFLLTVVKSIFQDMVSMDALVIKIMNFAQRLVDADRASLFLVDAKSRELYARVFDVGVSSSDEDADLPAGEEVLESVAPAPKEIRFPLGTGIAGQVALSGEVLNIPDAYCDPRFNRAVDQLTGYRTRSILCMPIFIGDGVIGVVQMVNKHSGKFLKEDEEAFEMFAVYCGLALHHAKLYDTIARSEQKYRVALDVLSYHNTCSEEEVERLRRAGVPDCVPAVDDYYFDVFSLDDLQKARHAVYMFKDLFGLARFDRDSVVRFALTVKKNYRRVPYHNWTHGFSVANSTFSIIKHSPGAFTTYEALALYVASLCHDLDHRGKNNKFMLETESPLAAIYSTSTMEHHHFNQTVTILQQKGHNIFSKLTNSEYKQVLGLVKHCILATDLAVFFPNRARLSELVSSRLFNWTSYEHRLLLQAITMTASDLSASAKPWHLQVKTVQVIFQEFYEQDDAERAAGRIPIPMMDRNQPDQQAASQVGFLTGICIPCYSLLSQLVPSTQPLLSQCQANLERWKEIDQEVVRRKLEKVRQKQEEADRRTAEEYEAKVANNSPTASEERRAPDIGEDKTTHDAETAKQTEQGSVPIDGDQRVDEVSEQVENSHENEKQNLRPTPNSKCTNDGVTQFYDGSFDQTETNVTEKENRGSKEEVEQSLDKTADTTSK